MARFVFGLAAVLEQRRARERERQLDLAAAQRERLAIEAQIEARRRDLEAQRADMRDALSGGGLDFRGVRMQAAASLRTHAQARQLVLRLAGAHQRIGAARERLVEAVAGRRAVERLRERRFEAWRAEMARREASATDELAIMRARERALEANP